MAWTEEDGKLIFTADPSADTETPDIGSTEDFEAACAHFREICKQIGTLIGNENFRGSFDEMLTFYEHDAFKTTQGHSLALAWVGVDEQCTYEGAKIGLGRPAWWYRCWELADDSESWETDNVSSFTITSITPTLSNTSGMLTSYSVVDAAATGTARYWVADNDDLIKLKHDGTYWCLHNDDFAGKYYRTADANPFTSENWETCFMGVEAAVIVFNGNGGGSNPGEDITSPVITVTTPVVIDGTQNAAINAVQLQATVSDGGAPTFTHTSGTMPNGLTLSSTGKITGTPTVYGSGSFIVTVTYSNATSKGIVVQWNFAEQEEITISTLSDSIEVSGVFGPVIQPIETGELATVSNGGIPTYTLNGLPSWMSVSNDGKLQGTPDGAGSGTGSIVVSYPGAESKTINVTWTVTEDNGSVTVDSPIALSCTEGTSFSRQLTATLNNQTATGFTFTASSLPSGLSMNSSGLISGTPTVSGTFTSTVTVSYPNADSATITINWTIEEDSSGGGDTPVITPTYQTWVISRAPGGVSSTLGYSGYNYSGNPVYIGMGANNQKIVTYKDGGAWLICTTENDVSTYDKFIEALDSNSITDCYNAAAEDGQQPYDIGSIWYDVTGFDHDLGITTADDSITPVVITYNPTIEGTTSDYIEPALIAVCLNVTADTTYYVGPSAGPVDGGQYIETFVDEQNVPQTGYGTSRVYIVGRSYGAWHGTSESEYYEIGYEVQVDNGGTHSAMEWTYPKFLITGEQNTIYPGLDETFSNDMEVSGASEGNGEYHETSYSYSDKPVYESIELSSDGTYAQSYYYAYCEPVATTAALDESDTSYRWHFTKQTQRLYHESMFHPNNAGTELYYAETTGDDSRPWSDGATWVGVKSGVTVPTSVVQGPGDSNVSYAFNISGITTPAEANGNYIEQSTNVYKHETNEYYVSREQDFNYWSLSPVVNPNSPEEANFYGYGSAGIANPWEVTDWRHNSASTQPGVGTLVITEGGSSDDPVTPVTPDYVVSDCSDTKANGNYYLTDGTGVSSTPVYKNDNGYVIKKASVGWVIYTDTNSTVQVLSGTMSMTDMPTGTFNGITIAKYQRTSYKVTISVTHDATGIYYEQEDKYNDQPVYKHESKEYYLWSNGTEGTKWCIAESTGRVPPLWWSQTSIEEVYTAVRGSGTATVELNSSGSGSGNTGTEGTDVSDIVVAGIDDTTNASDYSNQFMQCDGTYTIKDSTAVGNDRAWVYPSMMADLYVVWSTALGTWVICPTTSENTPVPTGVGYYFKAKTAGVDPWSSSDWVFMDSSTEDASSVGKVTVTKA